MNTYSYAIPLDEGKPADPHAGSPSLMAALAMAGDSTAQTSIADGMLHISTTLTSPESDAAYSSWTYTGVALERCKGNVINQIDARTEELLEEFEYLGNRYSMKDEQRIELLGTLAMANASLITASPWTPIVWPSRDGSSVTLSTAIDALAFTGASFIHAAAVKQVGNTHKDTIRGYTSVVAVEGWSDPR